MDMLQPRVEQKTGVHNCARCGETHLTLEWKRFKTPIEVSDSEKYTGWAMCPTTNDPIMFSVVQVDK